MAKPGPNQKKDEKSAALLEKMMKLLQSKNLAEIERTQKEAKSLVYKEKNKKTLAELKRNRSRSIRVLSDKAASIVDECTEIKTTYDDFVKHGSNGKDIAAQRDKLMLAVEEKRRVLKSFLDVLRLKHTQTLKFEGRVRKKAKELKEEPDEFKQKVGFPIEDAKKKANSLHLISKNLIKIGVQIKLAEISLELK